MRLLALEVAFVRTQADCLCYWTATRKFAKLGIESEFCEDCPFLRNPSLTALGVKEVRYGRFGALHESVRSRAPLRLE